MLRHALRRLLHAPTFTLAAVLTLTLGIGGAAGVFTLVNGVLLRPMPYDHADRLVDLSHTLAVSGIMHVDQSDATFLLYRRDNHVFTDIGAYRSASVNLGESADSRVGAGTPERATAAMVTASMFRVLRASPMLGRALIIEDDDRPGAAPVVVLGQRLWERSFGSDPQIVERHVMIDGVARQVVGVVPESFQLPDAEPALWVPLALDATNTKSAAFDYRAVARLRDGVTLGAATADLARLLSRVPDVFPGRLTVGSILQLRMAPLVRPLRDVVVGDAGRVLWIVLGAVGLLLLIACANVANLLLARAEGRQRELAVRSALGAGRPALLAELLADALILAVLGGVLGLACAAGGVRMLKSIDAAASIPRLAEVHVDGFVLAVTGAVTVLTALIVSALPLLRLDELKLASVLASTGRSATTGRTRHRARRVLVVAQVALALVLVSGAGLFARSFAHLRAVDPGFTANHALVFRLALPEASFPATRDAAGLVLRALDAIGAVPGAPAAGVITRLPLEQLARNDSAVYIEDHPPRPGGIPDIHEIQFVTPGYFGAMGIPLVAGRMFHSPDRAGEPAPGQPEVIVSEAFAMKYWQGADAVGKRVRMNPTDPWHTIVGVVGSVRGNALDQPPGEDVYCPLVTFNVFGKPWTPRNVAFVVRAPGDPAQLAAAVRRAVASVDRTLPLYRVMPLGDLVAAGRARTTFTLLLLSIAALVAATIGALGIYGVISYLVSLRTREIGVRLALGADARTVRLLVARQSVTDALAGVVVGLVVALVLTRAVGAVLFSVSPTDPLTFGAAAVIMLASAVVASWAPARRAASLDPAIALRSE